MLMQQAVAATKPAVIACCGNRLSYCCQDSGGRVDLEGLKDGELDYGCDQSGLAVLRQRLRQAVHNYEGDNTAFHACCS